MTLLRHVYIKLNDAHQTDAAKREVVDRSQQVLPGIASVQSLSVLVPADDSSRAAWDICLTLIFDSMDAFESYRTDPDHRAYVDEFLKPRMAVLKAWNFSAST